MNKTILVACVVAATLVTAFDAKADCAGATVTEVRAAHDRAQAHERAGRLREALAAYADAQDYTCEANPVEVDAARRAAALSGPLAESALARDDFRTAAVLFELGGHYARADQAMINWVRRDAEAYTAARELFGTRRLASFAENNRVRIAVTGPYRFDESLWTEIEAVPSREAGRALDAETRSFSERYLQQYVALIRSQPESPLDMAAYQRFQAAQLALTQKWQEDPLELSLEQLANAIRWALLVPDQTAGRQLEAAARSRHAARARILVDRYSGAPQLLERAMDYYRGSVPDSAIVAKELGAVRTLAGQLAAQADEAGSLSLAASYYEVAEDSGRAQAVRDRQAQLARQQVQPTIDEAMRQAAAIQQAFSDPAQVEAMRQQALAAQRAMQEQAASQGTKASRAEDLERELGM